MKKIMILGANILQLPAIKKAKEMGLYVGVVDYAPDAIGIPYADKYYNVSTIDEIGVCDACRKFRADGVTTLATDMPMRAVAYTCAELGLPGIAYDTAVKATDKGEMIKAFECASVEHPMYQIVGSRDEVDISKIIFPCISKPTDNAGSRGVMLIKNESEMNAALDWSFKCSRGGKIVIEEYMRGPEVSVEAFVIGGVPSILQITDKITTGAPHFVEMGHSQPSGLNADTQNRIKDLVGRAALSLGINNCAVHAEAIVTEVGPKMVELGARLGGDCITTNLVPLSTGIDMVKGVINVALGVKPDLEQKFSKGSAIRYLDAAPGLITCITGVEEAKIIEGIQEIDFTKSVGVYHKGIAGGSGERIGFVIAQGETAEDAVRICEEAKNRITITTDSKAPEANRRSDVCSHNMSGCYKK